MLCCLYRPRNAQAEGARRRCTCWFSSVASLSGLEQAEKRRPVAGVSFLRYGPGHMTVKILSIFPVVCARQLLLHLPGTVCLKEYIGGRVEPFVLCSFSIANAGVEGLKNLRQICKRFVNIVSKRKRVRCCRSGRSRSRPGPTCPECRPARRRTSPSRCAQTP